jgi:hypothetical protein
VTEKQHEENVNAPYNFEQIFTRWFPEWTTLFLKIAQK